MQQVGEKRSIREFTGVHEPPYKKKTTETKERIHISSEEKIRLTYHLCKGPHRNPKRRVKCKLCSRHICGAIPSMFSATSYEFLNEETQCYNEPIDNPHVHWDPCQQISWQTLQAIILGIPIIRGSTRTLASILLRWGTKRGNEIMMENQATELVQLMCYWRRNGWVSRGYTGFIIESVLGNAAAIKTIESLHKIQDEILLTEYPTHWLFCEGRKFGISYIPNSNEKINLGIYRINTNVMEIVEVRSVVSLLYAFTGRGVHLGVGQTLKYVPMSGSLNPNVIDRILK